MIEPFGYIVEIESSKEIIMSGYIRANSYNEALAKIENYIKKELLNNINLAIHVCHNPVEGDIIKPKKQTLYNLTHQDRYAFVTSDNLANNMDDLFDDFSNWGWGFF